MEAEDGLKILARLVAQENKDFKEAEREALRRSETVSIEPWEAEEFEPPGLSTVGLDSITESEDGEDEGEL